MRRHWHAVQFDVLRLGFRRKDMFTVLTVDEMVSIALAAPPGTAVYHAANEGFTLTDHLLAMIAEQSAGVGHLTGRIARPGVSDVRPATPAPVNDEKEPVQRTSWDTMSVVDFEKRRQARLGA